MSNSGAWGPTPPGVDLSENQNGAIIGSVVCIMVIGLASVILRLFTRMMRTGPGLALDDYVILFAAVMGIGTAVCCLVSVPWGGGKHLWVVTVDEFTKLYQTTYAFVIVYITCISATKTSILLFYRRMFGTSVVWYIVFGFTCAHWAEVTFTWLGGCQPIDFYWKQYTDATATGRCINAPLFYFCNGIIGLVIDVTILLVPIPTIWRLNLPIIKKIFIVGILLLGGFVCIASAVRIFMMDKLVHSPDFTWAMSNVFVWSCCEPWIGIVCACLPTYAPLVRRFWGRSGSSAYMTSEKFASDLPKPGKPGKRGDWSLVTHAPRSVSRCGDDEIELTVDISAQGSTVVDSRASSKARLPGANPDSNDIMVTKDFYWSSSL